MSNPDGSVSGVGRRDPAPISRTETGRSKVADKDKFKKLVERREEEPSVADADDEDEPKEYVKKASGIFDLASKKTSTDQAAQTQQPASPFALMSQASAKQKGTESEPGAQLAGLESSAKKQLTEETAQPKGRSFDQVRDDLTGLPQPSTAITQEGIASTAKPIAAAQSMQSLIDQIVDKLYTLRNGGITDTVMELKNPPVLAGAQLVLTAFDSAKGEFNIAFTNLTQQAKTLLEGQQATLMDSLTKHGYIAHIVVVTTQPYEPPKPVAQTEQAKQQRNQEEPDEKQQGRGKGKQG